jgi:hypothetical protein
MTILGIFRACYSCFAPPPNEGKDEKINADVGKFKNIILNSSHATIGASQVLDEWTRLEQIPSAKKIDEIISTKSTAFELANLAIHTSSLPGPKNISEINANYLNEDGTLQPVIVEIQQFFEHLLAVAHKRHLQYSDDRNLDGVDLEPLNIDTLDHDEMFKAISGALATIEKNLEAARADDGPPLFRSIRKQISNNGDGLGNSSIRYKGMDRTRDNQVNHTDVKDLSEVSSIGSHAFSSFSNSPNSSIQLVSRNKGYGVSSTPMDQLQQNEKNSRPGSPSIMETRIYPVENLEGTLRHNLSSEGKADTSSSSQDGHVYYDTLPFSAGPQPVTDPIKNNANTRAPISPANEEETTSGQQQSTAEYKAIKLNEIQIARKRLFERMKN